jgi:hypothetical protein
MSILGLVATVGLLGAVSPFKFIEPVNKINGVAANSLCTIELPPGKRLNIIGIEATVTKAAAGSGVFSIPLPSDIIDLIQVKVGGKPQRTRLASELFGAKGLNAIQDYKCGGTVQYWQAGSVINATPQLIGSANDLLCQAASGGSNGNLVANTATKAIFWLPIIFTEPWRKEYVQTEALGLVQAFADGSSIGVVTVEVKIPNNTGSSPAFSAHGISAWYEYDELVAPKGSTVYLLKEYRHNVQYAAAGDIEVATQLYNRDGLSRVSLLTAADIISRVVVKQGSRILRDLTNVRSQQSLISRDYCESAIVSNRFDIEFDLNDDPNSATLLNPSQPLSIVATLATANDATKNITVLSAYYGPLD